MKYLLLLSCWCWWGCATDPTALEQEKAALRHQLVLNFQHHQDALQQLAPYYHLKHIQIIGFHSPDSISIEYSTAPGGTGEFVSLENQFIGSAQVQAALSLDSLAVDQLRRLYSLLAAVGANQLRVRESYNAEKGLPEFALDLRYGVTMKDGRTFYYRAFQQPLDSVSPDFYGQPTHDFNAGGKLDAHTIWYLH